MLYVMQSAKFHLIPILLLTACAGALFAQGAPTRGGADQPYTMEYYYKVKWGSQQEFLQLFLKNHYPLLMKHVESGRILSVKIEQPANLGCIELLAAAQAFLRIGLGDQRIQAGDRGFDRRQLHYDIATLAIFLDHALNAAHLTLDPAQTQQNFGLRAFADGANWFRCIHKCALIQNKEQRTETTLLFVLCTVLFNAVKLAR